MLNKKMMEMSDINKMDSMISMKTIKILNGSMNKINIDSNLIKILICDYNLNAIKLVRFIYKL